MSGPNTRGPWIRDASKPRVGETIGGGWFVFRRGDGTNRIRPSQFPFEYASREEALARASAHALEQPGFRFDVVCVVESAQVTV